MLVTQPQPQDLEKYYESESYISHTDANKTLIDKLYQRVKKYSLMKKVRLISKYCSEGKNTLGCWGGNRGFSFNCKKKGWDVQGVEPNKDARLRAEEKGIGLSTSLHSLPNRKYG